VAEHISAKDLQKYIELSPEAIRGYLCAMMARPVMASGHRQEPFNPVEVILCYGLFAVLNPHSYGGGNIESVPEDVKKLATFFRRSPGSITSKMLNLDGSRQHGSSLEPWLYATLADQPDLYATLYLAIMQVARDISIGDNTLPDFLHRLTEDGEGEPLLGQYELPASAHRLIRESGEQLELERVAQVYHLEDRLTEKLVEQRVRVAQHHFARRVLQNCGNTCVFCGFAPTTLLRAGSGLLRASHIKPWAVSDNREKLDVRNGLAACPVHDAAFDQGYLAVEDTCSILLARILRESIAQDQGVRPYFDDVLKATLLLPKAARLPAGSYLEYHRRHIFRGDAGPPM
jgi:putative restriction endonuclease